MVNWTPAPNPAGTRPPISAQCHAALPWLGIYRGRETLKGFLAHMHRNLEVTTFGPREVVWQGEKAAAFGWFRLHALSTGRTADISYSILFDLRDSLIVKYHFLENTFDVAVAFQAGGLWLIATDGAERHVPLHTGRFGATKCPLRIPPSRLCRFNRSVGPGAWVKPWIATGSCDG
jgi:ketosteroid isomerase-like protein